MLHRLGVGTARHRFSALLIWLLFVALCAGAGLLGVSGQNLFDRLAGSSGGVDGEASAAAEVLAGSTGEETDQLSLLISGIDPSAPDLNEILGTAAADLAALDGVTDVINPLQMPPLPDGSPNPAAAPLLAEDGQGLLFNVSLLAGTESSSEDLQQQVVSELEQAAAAVRQQYPDASAEVGGTPLLVESLVSIAEADLQRGEIISLPIALLVMLVIFGGFLAASLPLIGAIVSILGALGALFGFSYLMDIDTTVVNVVTVIGLGLSIDYGLLIVSRFREEFRALIERRPTEARHELMLQAVGATLNTAGRTVLFSGLTFAIAALGLFAFEPALIRAIAIGAVSVVVIAILTALTLVPALLGYFGEKLIVPGALTSIPGLGRWLHRFGDVAPTEGFFSRLTCWVQRRPAMVAGAGIVVLALLGSPVLTLNVTSNSYQSVPAASSQYTFITELNEHFPGAVNPRVQLVSAASEADASAWAEDVTGLENVESVSAPVEINAHWVSRVAVEDGRGTEVVDAVRSDRPDFEHWVGGTDAASVDFTDALAAGAPLAVLVITVATFVLLFLMTGSVVIPIKALLISTLSLGASVGVLVWGFEDGHLAGLLNFDPADVTGVDALVLTLVLTFGFGLAMDYEMFLLSRIKEHFEQGESTRAAIVTGLQSSGRIITSAALIIVVVFAGFSTGDLLQLKQIGVALSVTVLLDATLVRALLVPAVMTVLHKFLWWAPAWSKPLYQRFGLREP